MNDPWQFLILDPNTASERDVKAAYARLLKQHRPDKDPAGFRKLREAYEAALDAVQRRNATPAPPVIGLGEGNIPVEEQPKAAPSPPMPLPTGRDALPESLRSAYDDLEHAISSENSEQVQAAVNHFESESRRAGLGGEALAGALQKAFRDDPKLTARGITDGVLVWLAEEGQLNFCHVIVSVWQEEDNTVRLVDYGNALMNRCAFLSSADGSMLMARIGLVVALEHPADATRLANAAFPHLPVEGREHLMSQLERGIALGKLFSDLPPNLRPFWFRQLRANSSGQQDWSASEAKQAVNYLIERRGAQWGGWNVVNGLMTPEAWKPVEERLRKQVKRAQKSQGGGGFGVPRFLLGPAVFIVITIVRMLNSSVNSGIHYESPRSPSYYQSEAKRLLDDYQKYKGPPVTTAPIPSRPPPFYPTQSSQPLLQSGSGFSVNPASTNSDRRVLDNLRAPKLAPPLQASPNPTSSPSSGTQRVQGSGLALPPQPKLVLPESNSSSR
jgi:hypothetical protein